MKKRIFHRLVVMTMFMLFGGGLIAGCDGGSDDGFSSVSSTSGTGMASSSTADTGGETDEDETNGFFVDANAGDDATGSFEGGLPFKTIQAAVDAAGTGDTIVVRPGTYTAAVTLVNGQTLQGASGETKPVLTRGLILADDDTLRNLEFRSQDVQGSGGGPNGGEILDCDFVAGADLLLFPGRGNWTISGNDFDNSTLGIVNNGEGRYEITGNDFATSGFRAVYFESSAVAKVLFQNNESGPGEDFDFVSTATGNICLRAVTNTVEPAGQIFFDNSAGGTFNLDAQTSGNSPVPTTAGTVGTPGSCTF